MTRLHCLIGNRVGACVATKAIRRPRHAQVRGRPTKDDVIADQPHTIDSLQFWGECGGIIIFGQAFK